MRIHTVRIRNFRCFGEGAKGEWGVTFRPSDNLSLTIGPNGSGKSALLDAIDLTLNAEGRSNRSLINEYDFPNCDTDKILCIEVVLTGLGHIAGAFESDIQWIDPADGVPVEEKNTAPSEAHQRGIIVRFQSSLDSSSGEIEWKWLLPKFPETEMIGLKELNATQHRAIGYFRINPAISAGAFSLGQYSTLGSHLRKLKYRFGKLPASLKGELNFPTCSIEEPRCEACPSCEDCRPSSENPKQSETLAQVLRNVVSVARRVLGSQSWSNAQVSLGPRFGGLTSALAGITLGLRTSNTGNAFIPFDQLSSGEKYAFSFALARIQAPDELPPIIVMEEPETALYPSAVATLLREIQAIPAGEAPQVLVSSHSEAVLRCFSPKDIIILGRGHTPARFQEVLDGLKPGIKNNFYKPEYRVMANNPSSLFADKVLVVEGAADAVTIGHLDRIAAKNAAIGVCQHSSFSSNGWCIFQTNGASEIPDSVRVLDSLGKRVAALFDGDRAGTSCAESAKTLCPTFIYKSKSIPEPLIEDVLLFGLPIDLQELALQNLQNHQDCRSCDKSVKHDGRCWAVSGACAKGNKDDRKNQIQHLCLNSYEENCLFPKVFENLLAKIECSNPGDLCVLDLG